MHGYFHHELAEFLKNMARFTSAPEIPTPIGQAPAFLDMLAHASQVAPLNRPVLVIGARGTGKELVASRLAMLSPRWNAPFIKLNCAALPETLLDSELFGHEVGAFTGAQRRRPGRFELADGGTIFLDEIATASPSVQEKLLRVIEYGTFERVGGGETLRVDVRSVAATNVHLPDLARDGKFRPDLLDRLAVDVINVPPLSARREDIAVLAQYFAENFSRELERGDFAGFTPGALAELNGHDWPGNVRELRNVVERSVYRMEHGRAKLGRIILDPFLSPHRVASAPAPVAAPVGAAPPVAAGDNSNFEAALKNYAVQLLRGALQASRFNQAEAARKLGLTYYQLRHLLRSHGMMANEAGKNEET